MNDSKQNVRELNANEHGILNKLLSAEFRGRSELVVQLKECKAIPAGDDDNYGSIYLVPESKVMADVTSRVPVEASYADLDGGSIEILLHVVEGLVHELEILRSDGSEMMTKEIQPDKLVVEVNS
jgi:hypothetical protein